MFVLFVSYGFSQQSKDAAVFTTKEGAIGGYDPVAYFSLGKPVKGQLDITFEWNETTWHFASAENRELFAKNPEKYAPEYGGWCAYGWSRGYPAKTDPNAWSIVNGKLYLNYDLKVQRLWNEKRGKFIQKADQNYGAAHAKQ